MTLRKIFIFLLSILLTMNSLAIAQEEYTMETTTEFLTDSSTSLLLAETDSIFITCDFDLENIESLLQYLPDVCTQIYNNRSGDLYNLYLEESQNFAKFYKKLNNYEMRDQPQGDKEELTRYPFEAELRNDIYHKVDWIECAISSNSSTADYLKCLKAKHLEMAELIPSVQKK